MPQVISTRMKEYDEKTKPLLARYAARNTLIDFEVKKGKKDYPRLKEVISPYLL